MAFAGVFDCFTQSRGNTDTMENFLRAVFDALYQTYAYLTPDIWDFRHVDKNLFAKHQKELNSKEEVNPAKY